MSKEDPNNDWWEAEPKYLDIPDLLNPKFQVDKPWEVLAAYPKMAWKVIKAQDDKITELTTLAEELRADVERLRNAAKMNEVSKHCGENRTR